MNKFLRILICLQAFSLSHAAIYEWNASGGGDIGDPTNWSPYGVPGSEDFADFLLFDEYTVYFTSDHIHDRLLVDGSDLTLDLNGYGYRVNGNYGDFAVMISESLPTSLTLYGGWLDSGDVQLCWLPESYAQVQLFGQGTEWFVYRGDQWGQFNISDGGSAYLGIFDQAILAHGEGISANFPQDEALIEVDGPNSEWYVDGWFGLSMEGRTTLQISDGAAARFGFLDMGFYPGSSAVIDIDGQYQQAELTIHGWWDDASLIIGSEGRGVINVTDSIVYNGGPAILAERPGSVGTLSITGDSWVDCEGSIAVGGSLTTPGGTGLIYLEDDPWESIYSDLTCAREQGDYMVVWPRGTVRMNGGGIWMDDGDFLANPIYLKGGTLEGWGWIGASVRNESGVVAPGVVGDWGMLQINYGYTQYSTGTLKTQIGGLEPYDDYGVLVVDAGTATINGMLEVRLKDGFVPDYYDEFVILEAESIEGRFINASSVYVFPDGRFEVLYDNGRIVLTHFQSEPSCPAYPVGDLNRDCIVDLADFAIMAAHWLDSNWGTQWD